MLARSVQAARLSPRSVPACTRKVRFASSCPVKLDNNSLWRSQAYINGKWTSGNGSDSFDVYDPATNKKIGSCPDLTVTDTKEAISSASSAFQTWRTTTSKDRHDLLLKIHSLMLENSQDLASILTLENGKPLAEAKGEIAYGASFYQWFAEEALRMYGDVIPAAQVGLRNVVIKQPVGVVGIITPWNFPNAMHARKLAAALAAGCTAVMKAPSETPYSMLAMAEICERAGIPPGVVNVITTQTTMKEVGKEMCENKDVKKITFTGSTPVGKLLMSQLSGTLKRYSAELGGNAPFIVFEDADLDKAVEGAIASKFRSSGQTCVCANRFYVHKSVYAEFASRLAEKVEKFKVGNGFDEGVTHGPLIHEKSLKKVQQHVEDAKKHGAHVLVGGKPLPDLGPHFFEPTILTDVEHCLIDDEETFGPVAVLHKFDTEAEVIAKANSADVGLAGYFYSRDIGRVWRVAEALEVGMVGVNTGLISQSVIPFGGVKESGFGREGSKYGLADYTNTKLIALGGLDS